VQIGNEKSMRVEVRSVAPDGSLYMVLNSIFKAGIEGEIAKIKIYAKPNASCPTTFTQRSITSGPAHARRKFSAKT
jgi:glutamine synthetase